MTWSCSIHGLHIQSEFFIHGFQGSNSPFDGSIVKVIKGHCPLPEGARTKSEYFDWTARNTLLFWRDIGCFWIRDGKKVIVEPAPGVVDHLLRPVILGAVVAILLLQREFVVLHASAVVFRHRDGTSRATGFLGHSGYGKSTTATALHGRGHRALADDTIAVPVPNNLPANAGWPLIHPALPHFKLRAPSVQALGRNVKNLSLWHPEHDSYVVPLTTNFSSNPAPLHSLYCLEEGDSIAVRRMNNEEALMNLLEHSYCVGLLPDDQIQADFLKCAQLARQLPVFSLRRPKDFNFLPDVARLIEEHQKSLGTPGGIDKHNGL